MRSTRLFFASIAAFAAVALAPSVARAEPSAFFFAGSGAAVQHVAATHVDTGAAPISFAFGVGSSPLNAFVAGGVFRTTTYVDLGTDLGLALRVANGPFARGDWGFAIDAGAGYRTWGNGGAGRWPLQARLIGGAPWGLELSVGGDFWDLSGSGPYASGISVIAGIDLLRLTVMRQGSTEHYWRNDHPAGGHQRTE